jgi:hypothetical protein
MEEIDDRKKGKISWDSVKKLITEPKLRARAMYKDYDGFVTNVINFFFVSNHVRSVKIEQGDRRFFPLQLSSKYKDQTREYFIPLTATFEHPMFYPTLLSYLLQLPTEDFNPYMPPMTKLKQKIIECNRKYSEQFILEGDWWRMRLNQKEPFVLFATVWDKFLGWVSNVVGKDPTKCACARNGFSAEVEHWVVSNKGGASVGNNVILRPTEALIAYWAQQQEEEEEVPETRTPEEIHQELVMNQRRVRAELRHRQERRGLLDSKIAVLRASDPTHRLVVDYDGMGDELNDENIVEDLLRDLE